MPVEQVVVVGKTWAGQMFCIGALTVQDANSLRLKRNQNPPFWPPDSPFEIGRIFEVDYRMIPDPDNPHHVEDAVVNNFRQVNQMQGQDLIDFLEQNNLINEGDYPTVAFNHDGFPHPMRLSGNRRYYINEEDLGRLQNSTGFWRTQYPLTLEHDDRNKPYYSHPRLYQIGYVGATDVIQQIEPNTIIRLSTSTKWDAVGNKAFLQLSGWF